MSDYFEKLRAETPNLIKLAEKPGAIAFLAQETMRFCSIASSLQKSFPLDNRSAEERYITHILGRSLLEGFFWLVYIFDDPVLRQVRFDEKINAFKREYGKFWNEKLLPGRAQMEPAGATWSSLPQPLDVNSMLAKVKNDHGDRLSDLYLIYRVASFDTHGNSLSTFFETTLGKDCNFPVLDFNYGFELIANQYLVILGKLRNAGEI